MKNIINSDKEKTLYFGNITDIYYFFLDLKKPSQLDQINEWFPGFLIEVIDDGEKEEAQYKDTEYRIEAHRINNSIYSGGTSNRVTQIAGRLIGTARSNPEKERKTAELIRKHIARRLIREYDLIESLQNNVHDHLSIIPEEKEEEFFGILINLIFDLTRSRNAKSENDKDSEPFPFEDYVFEELIYNVACQLHLYTFEGVVNAYMWLLLGSFLRNEVGTVLKMYHSGFISINRQLSEKDTLEDKLNYFFDTDSHEETYSGDDFNKRFPGITWICDNPECEEILDYQDDFDDHLEYWQCRNCGHINKIGIQEIYENTESYLNGEEPIDPAGFEAALKERKAQLDIKDQISLDDAIKIVESRSYKKVVLYTPYNKGFLLVIETDTTSGMTEDYLYYVDEKGIVSLISPDAVEGYDDLEFSEVD